MLIKFWGVHGSLPRPGPATQKFGGNTACVEVRCENTILIFDAGSGLRELGQDLKKRTNTDPSGRSRIRAHIFLSHFHWDHIQGFPFFEPAYIKGNRFDIYAQDVSNAALESSLKRQMAEPHFPITIDFMAATLKFHALRPGHRVNIGDVHVRTDELYHPGGCSGYRVDYRGKSVVYATDCEHVAGMDQALIDLAKDTDVLIYDSSFTPAQYIGLWDDVSREAWGHSTWEAGVALAEGASARQLVLFHHVNDDAIVEETERKAQALSPNTIAAYEGLEIEL